MVETDQPRRPAGDVARRTTVTVWPLFTVLLNFDAILGLLSGTALLGVCNLAGAPAGVQVAVWVVCGAAVGVASWLRTSIRFCADDLVVTMLLWPRRVPWARASSVTFSDQYEDDARPVEATSRRVHVSYRRDPSTPTGPVPATLGEFRPWARLHFRTVRLPLAFPPPADSAASRPSRAPRTWFGRHADRQRQIIRREFDARGYPLPD
jgi:hypothetical protein